MPTTRPRFPEPRKRIVLIATKSVTREMACAAACLSLFCIAASLAQAQPAPSPQESGPKASRADAPTVSADPAPAFLASGFQQLYSLHFEDARQQFADYQKARPGDPMGKAAEAASYLFQEFNAKGVLSSEFFLDDNKLLNGLAGNGQADGNPKFVQANRAARSMARERLKADATDTNALLVLTMTDGMESDYDQIIEGKDIPALSMTKRAEEDAHRLLALNPDAKDAYVALGAAHYIIGCLPSYKRAFLWFGGIHGDREKGIREMKVAATEGGYLRPFAKILLALAYRREHDPDGARALLAQLVEEFPSNPRFAYELSLVQPHRGTSGTPAPPQCCN